MPCSRPSHPFLIAHVCVPRHRMPPPPQVLGGEEVLSLPPKTEEAVGVVLTAEEQASRLCLEWCRTRRAPQTVISAFIMRKIRKCCRTGEQAELHVALHDRSCLSPARTACHLTARLKALGCMAELHSA